MTIDGGAGTRYTRVLSNHHDSRHAARADDIPQLCQTFPLRNTPYLYVYSTPVRESSRDRAVPSGWFPFRRAGRMERQ